MYLVNTDVLSSGAPTKAERPASLLAWMDRNTGRLFASVIPVAEIEAGIAKNRRDGARRKADRLADWLAALLHLDADRILPLDITTARRLGCLIDAARGRGETPGLADLAIAGTAAIRDCTVFTRNTPTALGGRGPEMTLLQCHHCT